MNRPLTIGLAALLSLTALAACGSDDDDAASDVQEENAEFCEDLSAYGASLAAFIALDPATATKEEYESAADAVKSARGDVAESRGELVEAELDNLETQADDLDGLLADAPDDAVVADIVTAAQTQVAQVQASAALVNTAVCTAGSATTTEA